MSKDSILTPQEKVSVSNEWKCIQEEYRQNETNANSVGMTNDDAYKTYQSAYSALSTYVGGLALTTNSNTDITQSEFQNTFSAYYAANVAFLNALSDKVAKLEVDKIEVGGRNLLRYTDQNVYFDKFTMWQSSLSLVDGWIKVTQNSGSSTSGVITDKTSDISLLEKGKSYILSFDAYLDDSAPDTLELAYLYVMSNGGNFPLNKSIFISKEKERYNVSFTYNGTTTQSFGAMVGATTTNCPIFYVKNIKLEKGNKATDWTCAPEDTDDAIDKVSSVAVYSGNISEKYYEADLAHSCWLCSVGAYPCETSATENNGYTNAAYPYNASCIVVTRAGEKNVYIDTLDYIDILGEEL